MANRHVSAAVIEAQLGSCSLSSEQLGSGCRAAGSFCHADAHATADLQARAASCYDIPAYANSVPVVKQRGMAFQCSAAADVFSPTTSSLLSAAVVEGDRREALMRACFAEAFQREVEHLQSLNIGVTKERKRQILADILVWAEVTQSHYDQGTRSFVLEPNQHDESFLRVGQFLQEAQEQHRLDA